MKPVERLCSDFGAAVDELIAQGFRVELIYPADSPHSATLTRGDEAIRLSSRPDAPQPSLELPPFRPEFILSKGGDSGGGRAGMAYRDLIPGRLGGRYIASEITIERGGPVADWVHFHRVAFQLICVHRGWVRLVYEDQGDPFVMEPGDLVLQPPGIRHRVLESSPGLKVIELGCPALHETCADHDLGLPTSRLAPDRLFAGQRFLRHSFAGARWTDFAGGEAQETGLGKATGGLADARIICSNGSRLDFEPHSGELVFGFLLGGQAVLNRAARFELAASDAFVIPPDEHWSLDRPSDDFRLLHVTSAQIDENCLAARDRSPL